MRKLGCLLYVLLISVALGMLYTKYFQAPASTDEEEVPYQNEEESTSSDHEDLKEEVKGDAKVSIEGEASFEDHQLTLDVETNLIKGTTVSIHTTSFDDRKSTVTAPKFLHLQEETSFTETIDIPEAYDRGFKVKLKFAPDFPAESEYAQVYGDKGQKLEGPLVHRVERYSDEAIYKEAKTSFYVLPEEDGSFKMTFGDPEWEMPDDLGDETIRLEAEATADDDYIYVDGKSNILEGAVISVSIIDDEEQYIDLGSYAVTNPDGSFQLIYEYEEAYKEYEEKFALVSFMPVDLSASWLIEQYGVDGKDMKGDLVKDQEALIIVPIKE